LFLPQSHIFLPPRRPKKWVAAPTPSPPHAPSPDVREGPRLRLSLIYIITLLRYALILDFIPLYRILALFSISLYLLSPSCHDDAYPSHFPHHHSLYRSYHTYFHPYLLLFISPIPHAPPLIYSYQFIHLSI